MRLFNWLHHVIPEARPTFTGLFVYTKPYEGCPIFFRFPQPLHPLEYMAAREGFGGCNPDPVCYVRLGRERVRDFLAYTAVLAEFLHARPQDVRLCWHACTPLSVPTPPWMAGVEHAYRRDALWIAVGKKPEDGRDCESKNWDRARLRKDFWEKETKFPD